MESPLLVLPNCQVSHGGSGEPQADREEKDGLRCAICSQGAPGGFPWPVLLGWTGWGSMNFLRLPPVARLGVPNSRPEMLSSVGWGP